MRKNLILGLALALSVVVAGCGGDDEGMAGPDDTDTSGGTDTSSDSGGDGVAIPVAIAAGVSVPVSTAIRGSIGAAGRVGVSGPRHAFVSTTAASDNY